MHEKEVLLPFQKRFLRNVTRPDIDTAALSLPRGNGKSWLAAHLLARVLTPLDKLFRPDTESVLLAASIEQARLCFRFLRAWLEPTGQYRFVDSLQRIGVLHPKTNTRLRVISSNGRTAMGLVNTPYAIADEPGSWETLGGELMNDALVTAQGKPGSPLKIVYIGTLAPSRGGWWHDLIDDGTYSSTYVQSLQGDRKTWDSWHTIRKANPLSNIDAGFRKKLLEERDSGRRDERLKARFLSYRLNLPTSDQSEVLLTVEDWELVTSRPVPEHEGKHIVGIDLGHARAWSSACAVWPNGRTEAVAVAPGIPSLEDQEKRDRVPKGTYLKLKGLGVLETADGLRVPKVSQLVNMVISRWGKPRVAIMDRFRLSELQDEVRGSFPLHPRVTRWSEASEDIRALRKLAQDGPLSVETSSRSLIAASMAAAVVKSDDQGNTRLVKAASNNVSRDDVAAALLLAAGAVERLPAPRNLRARLVS